MNANQLVGSNPELLRQVFSYVSTADLKRYRLINSVWEAEAGSHLRKRSVYVLDGWKYREEYLNETVSKLKVDEVLQLKNIRVVYQIPGTLSTCFGGHLVKLALKDVRFGNLAAVRRILFHSFPNMEELELLSIRLLCVDKSGSLVPAAHSGVKKLIIDRTPARNSSDGSLDVFDRLHYVEIFRNYPNLKDLTFGGTPDEAVTKDIFHALTIARVCLQKLVANPSADITRRSLYLYLEMFGSSITHLSGDWDGKVIRRGLKKLERNQFICMDVPSLQLNGVFSGAYENLSRLTISHSQQITLCFLRDMPNLKAVKYVFDWPKDTKWRVLHNPQVPGTSVNELTLCDYVNLEHCNVVFHAFPNVTNLTMSLSNEEFVCNGFLRKVCVTWPYLEELTIHGYSELAGMFEGRKMGVGNGTGNVLSENMRLIAGLQDLRCFRQTYPTDKPHLNVQDVYFGNADVFGGFFWMPKLNFLKLSKVAMTSEYILVLRQKIRSFECGDCV